MSDELAKYRQGLVETERKLNEYYDKLLVTLSGGALALSITFLKDIVGSRDVNLPGFLFGAWALFVLSLTSILCEILFGIQAHKKAIKQVDNDEIYNSKPGGKFSWLSAAFRWIAATLLVAGLSLISVFAYFNMGGS